MNVMNYTIDERGNSVAVIEKGIFSTVVMNQFDKILKLFKNN